jgi:hypothetical protein
MEMLSPEEEAKKLAEEAARKAANEQHSSSKNEEDPLITKNEMRNEMRCERTSRCLEGGE